MGEAEAGGGEGRGDKMGSYFTSPRPVCVYNGEDDRYRSTKACEDFSLD